MNLLFKIIILSINYPRIIILSINYPKIIILNINYQKKKYYFKY